MYKTLAKIAAILEAGIFDINFYTSSSEQFDSVEDAIAHYLDVGADQLLNPNHLFDTAFYQQKYAPGINPLLHYIKYGNRLNDPSPLFDTNYYLSQLQEPLDSNVTPLADFLRSGWRHRNPNKLLDSIYYRERYPDIAEHDVNPIIHYIDHGAAEGRDPCAQFDTKYYRLVAGLDTSSPINPLSHYLLHGQQQGLLTHRARLQLSERFRVDQADWLSWMAARSKQRKGLLSVSRSTALIFVLPDEQSAAKWARKWHEPESTLESVRSVTAVAIQTLLDGTYESAVESVLVGTDAIFLMVGPNDVIHSNELDAACREIPEWASLAVFDLFATDGLYVSPVFLPGANAIQLRAADISRSRFLIRSSLFSDIRGTLKSRCEPREILLSALSHLDNENRSNAFTHLPFFAVELALDTLEVDNVQRQLLQRMTEDPQLDEIDISLPVSVVISTKDNWSLLQQLVDNLLTLPTNLIEDIIIVSNNTTNPIARVYLDTINKSERVCVIKYDKPFNFSAQSNLGANNTSGELILFINDDVIPVHHAWLQRLASTLAGIGVGIAAPLLLYPGGTIQHAGMHLGFGISAGHSNRGAAFPGLDPSHHTTSPRQVSAVTGAVFLVKRQVFDQLGGFDEQLGQFLQDVDFCLRAGDLGIKIAYEPAAVLVHCESVSVALSLADAATVRQRQREVAYFLRRWGSPMRHDPYHNPAYDTDDESMRKVRQR